MKKADATMLDGVFAIRLRRGLGDEGPAIGKARVVDVK
jgi:hypothetical protein